MFKEYYQVTEFISLRKIRFEYASQITESRKFNKNYLPFLTWIKTLKFTDEESLFYIEDKLKNWSANLEWTFEIFWEETLIGDFQIRKTTNWSEIEIGYWLDYRFRLKNIMSTIINFICSIAKSLNINWVIIVADPKNIASINLAIKLGFKETQYWIRKNDQKLGLLTFAKQI
ncbi:GNAT family N-acetyltransferase [Mycoplasmoides pirum]|uniref:GNAT family N-acetyltransferase n=1 Tax=Mycoplasmoides pirum TaxID=2122 RepID=UPI00048A1742|nr:GNAT family N-acetyltransferase [Mycoplasmoides pirum]